MCIFQLNNIGPRVNKVNYKQPEITNDALLTQTEIWQPQNSRCPSNVTSDTVLAVPVEQLETENTPQTPFLPLAVLSANQSWVVLLQRKLVSLLHLYAELGLPHYSSQNCLQTVKAVAECLEVRMFM